MKVVALEEHFATEQMLAAWRALRPDLQDIAVRQSTGSDVERRLFDLGPERIELMDKAGVQVQVLSLTTPGVQSLDASEGVSLARDTNDVIADAIRAHPNRFQGFATVATPNASEAARELDRAIRHLRLHGAVLCGRTRDRNLDDVEFLPIFEAASALNVPLYLHPQSPRTTVREAYYSGFGNQLDAIPKSGMHAFRHHRCSFLVEHDVPVAASKQWLGHGSEQMIRRYTHHRPEYHSAIWARIPSVLSAQNQAEDARLVPNSPKTEVERKEKIA